ncbi:uncharacterized protein LY89DRAFT_281133 [Mollisia scopiformis]|uniref:Uncharacterized protein n=1 Tax=Mollisia scopiformis TaxID=149040 RepID=A0A132B9Z5_MOLSC|nr:uncharacterized protein LY89DRAFT_281133 [Mollisia scopiformis]KUJ09225.1 hypothetical protein LY89DRAFT_281133 [Mollisia scopiformis]
MEHPPPYVPHEPITTEDLETASIRSAAPSYVSDTPTYVSTIPPSPPRTGLPPIPPLPAPPANPNPSLDAYRISSWSKTQTSNPTTKHYQRIAQRRASNLTRQQQSCLLIAALNGEDGIAQIKKKMDAEQRAKNIRTNEDPYLVGEEAAEQNRQERLRKENGWGVLEREDKRWDWLLAQMSDWEERDKNWKRFRKEVITGNRRKLSNRFGFGGP